MDAADVDQAQRDLDVARRQPAPEPVSGAREHDRFSPLERLGAAVGNRAVGRLVARMRDGEGILPSGLVHPDVEAAIAAAHSTGRRIDPAVSERVGSAFGEQLDDVRVHTGDGAAELARAVSARAFTVGNDIFFAPGEYRPQTSSGHDLIAHELAHVVQQRGAPRGGPLVVSQPGDATEREAETMAREASA